MQKQLQTQGQNKNLRVTVLQMHLKTIQYYFE